MYDLKFSIMEKKLNIEIKAKSAEIINSANEQSISLTLKGIDKKELNKLLNDSSGNIEYLTFKITRSIAMQIQEDIKELLNKEEKVKEAIKPKPKKHKI